MEALHLARESAALKGMVADVHGLVHEQEEYAVVRCNFEIHIWVVE